MITIVGAGLVGSLWALLLKKKGYDVTVFERRPDPRAHQTAGGRSINLVITSRGLFALEKAGILKDATELAVPVYGRMIHSKNGDLTYQPYGMEDECNLSISRGALNSFLISKAETAGVKIHFDHDLSDLNPETRALAFQTPYGLKNASYDILFGADGAGSRVRKALAQTQNFSEKTEWLEADYKELTLLCKPNGQPQLRTDALHIWPRGAHMMMALANRDGSFTVTAYLPKSSASWSFDHIKTQGDVEALFSSEFPDAISLMPDYISEFLNHPRGALGTVHSSKWVVNDSIALIGDAAHAILPFFGQGMNCGFEDCTVLLAQLEHFKGDWAHSLRAYEKNQKPNADAIADMALENWIEMKSKVADARFLLRKKVEAELEHRYPSLYKSRYGLITYTLTPYALAQRAGLLQNKIIDEIIGSVTHFDEISWPLAAHLIQEQWQPFVDVNHLDVMRYPPRTAR